MACPTKLVHLCRKTYIRKRINRRVQLVAHLDRNGLVVDTHKTHRPVPYHLPLQPATTGQVVVQPNCKILRCNRSQ